jgi:transposase
MLSNAIRGHMAELGIISAKGRNGTVELLEIITNADDNRVPAVARLSLGALARQYANTTAEIRAFEKHIHAWHRSCEESRRLEEIPGVGPIVATALVVEVGDWKAFSSGRNLAAWIGLVPKQHSTGGKERLDGISKQGNRICDGCSSLELWLSFDTRGSTVRNGFGSRVSWNVGRSRSLLSRWPTRLHVWPAP